MTGVAAVAAGYDQTLALKTDGSLWAWGNNWYGQLGDGTMTARYTPVPVIGFNGGGATHQVTATAGPGGSISPASRTVAQGATTSFTVAPDSGYAIGTVSGCGGALSGTTYTTGAISADCAVSATFTALPTYQVTATAGTGGGISPASRTVAQGATTTFTVTPNPGYAIATVSGCGGTLSGTTDTTGAITAACAVSATFSASTFSASAVQRIAAGATGHSLAIKPDGSLWAWGDNSFGELGIGRSDWSSHSTPVQVLTGVAAVAAGGGHTLALKTDGTLWAWGDNGNGQVGDGTTAERHTPLRVLTGVAAVAASGEHSLALQTDGTLWSWGDNGYGQLGDGTTMGHATPVQVVTGVAAVATGGYHTLAIKTNGTLWAWGDNRYGQLGDGTTTNRRSPVQVLSGVVAVAAGSDYTLALKTDGSLWAWGRNNAGQFGDGTTTDRRSPVRVTGFNGNPSYQVTATAGPGGGISPASRTVPQGTSTTFTVTPNAGYGIGTVSGCDGALAGSTYTTGPINGACAVRATFSALPRYPLTVSKTGSGTVTSVPAGINCGTTCQAAYYSGTSVVLTAKTATGSQFADWTDCPNPNGNTCTVAVTEARTVQARFVPTVRLTLSKTPAAYGTVTSSPAGITCGTTCTSAGAAFPQGTTVTLTAQPRPGRSLKSWSGTGAGACTGTDLSCTVPMDAVKSVKVVFQ